MPSYKLTYFNGRGRGEIARMLLAASGKKFEDVRIEFSDWPALKAKLPQGTLPVLEIDGKMMISQSATIARYLARECNLYGKTNMDATYIDQLFDTLLDAFGEKIKVTFNQDEKEKAELMKVLTEEKIPKFLNILEKLLIEAAGKGGYAVGSGLTMGDLALFVYLEHLGVEEALDKYPKLKENRATVAKNANVAKYMAARPKTEF